MNRDIFPNYVFLPTLSEAAHGASATEGRPTEEPDDRMDEPMPQTSSVPPSPLTLPTRKRSTPKPTNARKKVRSTILTRKVVDDAESSESSESDIHLTDESETPAIDSSSSEDDTPVPDMETADGCFMVVNVESERSAKNTSAS